MRWRIWLRLRPGHGFATTAELWLRWGRLAALGHGEAGPAGHTWRIGLRAPTVCYAVRFGRAQWGRRAFGRMQDQVLILAPPQSGKSGLLADRILDHPGPVVCTSTRDDLFVNTAGERAQLGPAYTFNPLGIGGVPSTFGWDIIAGCEEPGHRVPPRRGPDRRLPGRATCSSGSRKRRRALAALMHAAALGGRTILDVTLWADKDGTQDAVDILQQHRPGGLLAAKVQELRATTGSGRIADSIRTTITEALGFCTVPKLLESATPGGPGCEFNVYEFLRRHGTLYMIAGDDAGNLATLFRAFAAYIHYEAGLTGSNAPAGKLDPPVLFALDEVTQICPCRCPAGVADSAGKGIVLAIVAHTKTQLAERWGKRRRRHDLVELRDQGPADRHHRRRDPGARLPADRHRDRARPDGPGPAAGAAADAAEVAGPGADAEQSPRRGENPPGLAPP